MKTRYLFRPLAIAALIVLAAILQQTLACPACYGNAQSSRIDGMNTAILTMVGIVGFVLTGISSFFIRMVKRSHNLVNGDSSVALMNHKETN
jgi:heme/copper-type cytochrome/quinol oxidase subunit 2